MWSACHTKPYKLALAVGTIKPYNYCVNIIVSFEFLTELNTSVTKAEFNIPVV